MAINNICSIIFMLVVVLMIRSSVQESCHNAMGKSLCDLKKCPKVQCKGKRLFSMILFLFSLRTLK